MITKKQKRLSMAFLYDIALRTSYDPQLIPTEAVAEYLFQVREELKSPNSPKKV